MKDQTIIFNQVLSYTENGKNMSNIDSFVNIGESIIKLANMPFDFLFGSLKFILSILSIYIIYVFVKWLKEEEMHITIYPFDIKSENLDGKAISDLLISDIDRISRSFRNPGSRPIPSLERESNSFSFSIPSIYPLDEIFERNLTQLGTLSLGPISLSISQILLMLKNLSPFHRSMIISGSVQNYSSSICIIIHLVDGAWRRREKISTMREDSANEQEDPIKEIPTIIKKLSFRLFRKLVEERIDEQR